ncbi:hypothetical protein I3F58_26360 [Streptomyces sp. MUM 203J]|uniref:hypothetical protein n=1 Tax=Streptomyces sp. MUM 203J TaxID=2791990 RepID=UPI001F039435|nr:hypothetical protein [Streptomyces sp. MUM 203J]MCH0543014.1 hypothetical protein [Streptomyces sp. MUM 203J]
MSLLSVLIPLLLPPSMLAVVMAMARYEELVLPEPVPDGADPLVDPEAEEAGESVGPADLVDLAGAADVTDAADELGLRGEPGAAA